MAGSRRYPAELHERAVRMVAEVRDQYASEWVAIESVAAKLGIGTHRRCCPGCVAIRSTPERVPGWLATWPRNFGGCGRRAEN